MKNSLLLFAVNIFLCASCVSPKIHNNLVSDFEKNKKLLNEQDQKNLLLSDNLDELNDKFSMLKNKIEKLKSDSTQNGTSLLELQKKYQKLNVSYDLLTSQSSREMSNKAKEIKRLLEQLEESQNQLLGKEDELNTLSLSLSIKKNELNKSQEELEKRSARVLDLEKVINQKDSLVTSIKEKISKSLMGLEGEGLTIEKRNGKIYISMEEDLLFASGKYQINETGLAALSKLSNVLSNQDNIEILIEGHTDNIPINQRKLIKDNWDLSVMRATSVVRILLNNNRLDPLQFTAAGRGEYSPISNNETDEGRKMNRRIEMILSPNLDDLYDILEE